jgi:hypothetical protein
MTGVPRAVAVAILLLACVLPRAQAPASRGDELQVAPLAVGGTKRCRAAAGESAEPGAEDRALCDWLGGQLGTLEFGDALRRFGAPSLADLWGAEISTVWETDSGSLGLAFDRETRRLRSFSLVSPVALPLPPVPFCIGYGKTLLNVGGDKAPRLAEHCRTMSRALHALDLEQVRQSFGEPTLTGRHVEGGPVVYASWFGEDRKRWLAIGLGESDGKLSWFYFRDAGDPRSPRGISWLPPVALDPGKELKVDLSRPE